MKCPICNVWTSVLDTRNKTSVTVRRRKCGNEHIFITEEHVKLQRMPARVRVRKTRPTDTLIVVTNKNVFNVWK